MKRLSLALAGLIALSALAASSSFADPHHGPPPPPPGSGPRTPITHVVEIFQENVSFDHYFGTYPQASNGDGHFGFGWSRPGMA